MSLRLLLEVVSGDYPRMMERARSRIAFAATGAITDAAKAIETRGRQNIASAGFGPKWSHSLHAKIFPANGATSLSPAAVIASKIPYSNIFETGGDVFGIKGILWLPLKGVPIGRGGHPLTPKQYVARIGPLKTIKAPGKHPMLAGRATSATIARATFERVTIRKKAVKSGGAIGQQWVPLYVGVTGVHDPKKFDIAGITREERAKLAEYYVKNFQKAP